MSIDSSDEEKSVQPRILALQTEHRKLDDIVTAMSTKPEVDQLQLKRMKMRKLQLKDQISRLKSALIPDLDA